MTTSPRYRRRRGKLPALSHIDRKLLHEAYLRARKAVLEDRRARREET